MHRLQVDRVEDAWLGRFRCGRFNRLRLVSLLDDAVAPQISRAVSHHREQPPWQLALIDGIKFRNSARKASDVRSSAVSRRPHTFIA